MYETILRDFDACRCNLLASVLLQVEAEEHPSATELQEQVSGQQVDDNHKELGYAQFNATLKESEYRRTVSIGIGTEKAEDILHAREAW